MELVVRAGDHGFDAKASLEDQWLKEGLEKVTKLWLS